MYGQFVIYILRHFNQLRDNKRILKIAFMSGDRDLHLPGHKESMCQHRFQEGASWTEY